MFCIYTHPVNSKSTIWQYRKEICTIHILLYMYKSDSNWKWWLCKKVFSELGKCKFLCISSIKKIEMVTPISDGWLQSPITLSRFLPCSLSAFIWCSILLTTHLDPSPYDPCEPWLNISDILIMYENIPSDICWSDIHFLNIVPLSEDWREK